MKKGVKAKPEEIINILRRIEISLNQGKTIPQACRECEITDNTYYRWRKQYGGMELSHLKELKRLQEENSRLKKAVADLTLDKLILEEAAEEGPHATKALLRRSRNLRFVAALAA